MMTFLKSNDSGCIWCAWLEAGSTDWWWWETTGLGKGKGKYTFYTRHDAEFDLKGFLVDQEGEG